MICMLGVVLFILATTRDPPVFVEVKERYRKFREYVATHNVPPKFKVLTKQIVLIGYIKKKNVSAAHTMNGWPGINVAWRNRIHIDTSFNGCMSNIC